MIKYTTGSTSEIRNRDLIDSPTPGRISRTPGLRSQKISSGKEMFRLRERYNIQNILSGVQLWNLPQR